MLARHTIPIASHWVLVGTIPASTAVNPEDGSVQWMTEEARRRKHEPYVAPLLGTDHLVVFSQPKHCLEVNRNPSMFQRGWAYKLDVPILGVSRPLLFTNEGESWKNQRAKANPHFKPSVMRNMFDSIVSFCQLVESETLNKAAGGKASIEMKHCCATVTISVILQHAFGSAPQYLLDVMIPFFGSLLAPEFLLRVMGLFWLPWPGRLRFFWARRKLLTAVERAVREAKPGTYGEMLPGDTMEDKLGDVMGVIFAGFDTTSNTIAWCLYHLSIDTNRREKVRQELRALLIGDSVDELTADTIRDAHYLAACVNETLRLHSPAPGHVGDVVAAEGAEIDGYRVPQGSPCYAMQVAYYLSDDYFDGAATFDPERWIDGRVDQKAKSLGLSVSEFFAPFLVGPHVCLGKQLAEMEARIVVARWIMQYDMEYAAIAPPRGVMSVAFNISALPMKIIKLAL